MSTEGQRAQTISVIGAGWGRTGTNALKTALDILGYNTYHMFENMKHSHHKFWIRVSDKENVDFDEVFDSPKGKYTATCDWPSSQYWEDIWQQYLMRR